jgi:hypothetical protein
MTRTHVEEGELVELQRKALALFKTVDEVSDLLEEVYEEGRKNVSLKELEIQRIYNAADLAREVSDQVDDLTDYVRHSRLAQEEINDEFSARSDAHQQEEPGRQRHAQRATGR